MKRLPASSDELRGLRAARWVRESTAGQVDRFGPDAQREQQDRAIERYGLVDTGLAWLVAHSGRTVAATADFVAMLAAAGDTYDVLVVGYVSRFARDLRTAVNARHDLHAAGASLLFADERLLSSDEEAWEQWAREAVEAEAYSRRLGKRIREGYAAKRRRLADPGGRAPFGFRRAGTDHLLEPVAEAAHIVSSVFELAAARLVDHDVASRTGLPLYTVRGMLRNPLYAGRLPDGSSTRFAPIVPFELWQRVQEVRDRRSTRDGRPAVRRHYALSMLHCRACGRRLIGDTGRYRHNDACPAFMAAAAAAERRARGQHRQPVGRSYPAGVYEAAIAAVLARVSLGADVVTELVAETRAPELDRLVLARLERDRDTALARYRRDRDQVELAATMARIDASETVAREAAPVPALEAAEVVAYLANLDRLWADAPASRRALAEALFDRVEVLGLRDIRITPSRAALDRGLAEAFRTGTHGYGRGERSRGRSNQLITRLVPGVESRIRLILPPATRLHIVERSA